MKSLPVLFLLLISLSLKGQKLYFSGCADCHRIWSDIPSDTLGHENSDYIAIDSTQENNIWQIGKPQKTKFKSSYFRQLGIVTDSLVPYPSNNISSFLIHIVNCSEGNGLDCPVSYQGSRFQIMHRMDSDTGVDGGTIEISYDSGAHWINLIEDTLYLNSHQSHMEPKYAITDTIKSLGKPGFSGSLGWSYLVLWLGPRSPTDIYLRFTFASDSIQNNRDGWLLGAITIDGIYESIQPLSHSDFLRIIPNPASNKITVQSSLPDKQLEGEVLILDLTGRPLLHLPRLLSPQIDISALPKGIYILKYIEQNGSTATRFIKS